MRVPDKFDVEIGIVKYITKTCPKCGESQEYAVEKIVHSNWYHWCKCASKLENV